MDGRLKVFNEKAPMENTGAGVINIEGKILVISTEVNFGTKEKGMEGTKSFDNTEQLLLNSGVPLLRFG
jgi:hypothetical protein